MVLSYFELRGVQTMEQIVIAYKKLKEAARLLAAASRVELADEVKVLSWSRWTGGYVAFAARAGMPR